jgi:hypothetical protein
LNIEIVVKIFKKNLQCAQLFSNNSLEKHRIKNPMGKKLKYPMLIMMENLEASYGNALIYSMT